MEQAGYELRFLPAYLPDLNMDSHSAISLAVERSGQGFPILCLHGHPGSGRSMAVFTKPLSSQFLTLAPDLRGYGRSRVKGAFEMADHLTDLIALLEREGITRSLILGWSLGGILALEMALRYPERVSGLILIATAAQPQSNHPTMTWQDNLYTGITAILNQIRPGWFWNIQTFGQRSLLRYLFHQQTATAYRYLATAALPAYLQTSALAHQALAQALRAGYNRVPDLQQISCPCLVLAGACDRHITPAASLETAQNLQNSDWICYSQTAHLFPWEIPQQVCEDIQHWLQQHPEVTQVSPQVHRKS